MDRYYLEHYLNIYKNGLLGDILLFWRKQAIDFLEKHYYPNN